MFYISSTGHSASGWVSNALSCHEKIVCFHGTRSIPPVASGYIEMKTKEFVSSLEECEKNCNNEKIFGACHGFHGANIYKDLNDKNGIFFALVRNPLRRVHSNLCTQLANTITNGKISGNYKFNIESFLKDYSDNINSNFDLVIKKLEKQKLKRKNLLNLLNRFNKNIFYKKIRNLKMSVQDLRQYMVSKQSIDEFYKNYKTNFHPDIEYFENYLKEENSKNISERASECFINCCNLVFDADEQIYNLLGDDCFIKMEEITKSKEYFNNNLLNKLINENGSEIYFNKIFNLKKTNQHSFKNSLSHEYKNLEIIDIWPKKFINYFMERYKNTNALKLYLSMDYKLEYNEK